MTETQNILIVRYGEIALKGMNKPYFEKMLLKRVRKAIESIRRPGRDAGRDAGRDEGRDEGRDAAPADAAPAAEITEGLIVVRGFEPAAEKELIKRILRVFGVATVSPAWELTSREQEAINAACIKWMAKRLEGTAPLTFKVFGKRSDKTWPVTSPEIAALAGEAILEAFGKNQVMVDVGDPQVRLYVHLRRRNVFIYDDKLKGFGGLPLGTNGKGLVLLSGGIDSPVAAWMMAKRGMTIEAVHFHSYPYTSKRAEEKVTDIADVLSSYCGRLKVHIINLLPVQEAVAEVCPEEEMTILIRRSMVRIAARVAEREGCGFLITGENLGQVASQTAEGIAVTDKASEIPVLRPLIALDKVDIIERALDIGTYKLSIQPYEDCCTVFLPKHPVTKPALTAIENSEALIGKERLLALEEESLSAEDQYIASFRERLA
jgi:thiamine biosynthesis protein ThiI